MKKTLLLLLMMFCFSLYSQSKAEKFTIIKIGNKYSKEAIVNAFEKADMCGNFHLSKPNDITLDDGAVVRFFSKTDLGANVNLNKECFVSDNFKFDRIVWSIMPNGYVAKGHAVRPNKSHVKE
jgi:hypothetical protein